jgi:hypothetical protein
MCKNIPDFVFSLWAGNLQIARTEALHLALAPLTQFSCRKGSHAIA